MILDVVLPKEVEETISLVFAIITFVAIMLILVGGAIYLAIYNDKLNKCREDYMKTLTDEQKIVIFKYQEQKNKVKVFTRKEKQK